VLGIKQRVDGISVKPPTIHLVMCLIVSKGHVLLQDDFNNAFLIGDIHEIVYIHQPPSYVGSTYPYHVCYLTKAPYGLKQAP